MVELPFGNRAQGTGRQSLSASIVHRDGVAVIRLRGRISIYGGGDALRDMVDETLDSGARRIVLNLQRVKHVDSSGLGQLVATHIQAGRHRASIRLSNLSPRVFDLLRTAQLLRVFDVFQTEEEAVSSFAGSDNVATGPQPA